MNKELDYIRKHDYTLIVRATDGGGETSSPDAIVRIYLTDVNNNPPIFNPVTYHTSLSERATTGATVDQVYATDADTGSNGEITYSIVGGDGTFGVNVSINFVCVCDNTIPYSVAMPYLFSRHLTTSELFQIVLNTTSFSKR